jgi:hypothetical protein
VKPVVETDPLVEPVEPVDNVETIEALDDGV